MTLNIVSREFCAAVLAHLIPLKVDAVCADVTCGLCPSLSVSFYN
jgi:hypothetical protein